MSARTDRSVAKVTSLLAESSAFADVDPAELERLARDATATPLEEGVPLSDEVGARPLLVEAGTLIVREAGDRPVDLLGRGGFRPPNAAQRLVPLQRSQVYNLPLAAVDVAWQALKQRPAPPRSRTPTGVELWSASLRTVTTAPAAGGDPGSGPLAGQGGKAVGSPASVDADAPVIEALLVALGTGEPRLPVVKNGRPVGVVAVDTLPALGHDAVRHLGRPLNEAASVDELAGLLRHLPGTVAALLAAGASATDAGRVLAGVSDRVMRRLLVLANEHLGPPPSAYAWLVFGSHGRREQSLASDQDTGLVFPVGVDADGHVWFARLGEWMTDALEQCGFPRCPGKVLACNPDWRHDVEGWHRAITRWTHPHTTEHLLGADIGFDMRAVAGGLAVEDTLVEAIAAATGSQLAQARLARDAVKHRPARGAFGRVSVDRWGPHRGTFDAKRRGLQPIVDLARVLTFVRGGTELGTLQRLAAAAADGELSPTLAASLRDGYELLSRLRLETQLETPGTRLAPRQVTPGVQARLRATFRDLSTAQRLLRTRFHLPAS